MIFGLRFLCFDAPKAKNCRSAAIFLRQHRTIPALRLKHRFGGSPRQEPPQAAVALRSASLRLGVRHGNCVAKMLDNVGLRYPHRASGAKAPRTLRPLPLLRFAASATGGAHLCSTKYYLRFWLSSCRTSLAVSALRIVRYCLNAFSPFSLLTPSGPKCSTVYPRYDITKERCSFPASPFCVVLYGKFLCLLSFPKKVGQNSTTGLARFCRRETMLQPAISAVRL